MTPFIAPIDTQQFVDTLFEAITNKSYLPQNEQPAPVLKAEKDDPKKEEVSIFIHILNLLVTFTNTSLNTASPRICFVLICFLLACSGRGS